MAVKGPRGAPVRAVWAGAKDASPAGKRRRCFSPCRRFFVAAHWVDVGDGTCGGVYRPDMWFGERRCEGRMLVRTGIVLGLAVLAGGVLYWGVRTRGRPPRVHPETGAFT